MGYSFELVLPDENGDRQFRVSGWTAHVRRLMVAFGMAFGETPPSVPYPQLDSHEESLAEELVDARIAGHPSPEASAVTKKHAEEIFGWLMQSSCTEGVGIPLGKLSSNSGWWVTPEECEAAVRAYDTTSEIAKQQVFEQHDAHLRDWFEQWVAFLRRGVEHRGFRIL